MTLIALITLFFLGWTNPELDDQASTYIDRIQIVDLIIQDEISRDIWKRKKDLRVGLNNRFENQSEFQDIRCDDLSWKTIDCDLYHIVRMYGKIRFLNTQWFDLEKGTSLILSEGPDFNQQDLFFHFSPVAVSHRGNKGVVLATIYSGPTQVKGYAYALTKDREWRIENVVEILNTDTSLSADKIQ